MSIFGKHLPCSTIATCSSFFFWAFALSITCSISCSPWKRNLIQWYFRFYHSLLSLPTTSCSRGWFAWLILESDNTEQRKHWKWLDDKFTSSKFFAKEFLVTFSISVFVSFLFQLRLNFVGSAQTNEWQQYQDSKI